MSRWATPPEASDDLGLLGLLGPRPAGRSDPAVIGRARVVVDGTGPAPEAAVALLRRLGVGTVEAGGYAADAAEGATSPPDLVVLTAPGPVPAPAGQGWRARGIPHLPLACEEGAATLGPLVVPGVSACLTCQDLVRTDLDPAWAEVMARALLRPVLGSAPVDAGERLTPLVASLTALVVLGWLEGAAPMPGVSAEVALPWPTVVHRHWPAHPRCGCGAAAPPGDDPRTRGFDSAPAAQDTMAG